MRPVIFVPSFSLMSSSARMTGAVKTETAASEHARAEPTRWTRCFTSRVWRQSKQPARFAHSVLLVQLGCPLGGVAGLPAEKCAQPSMARTADRQLRPRVQNSDIAIFAVGFDSGDAFEIHNVRTVNAKKTGWVEGGL